MKTIKLFTVGYTKKNAEEFFRLLENAGVKKVVDIRLNNTSQLAGFAKKNDLRFFLKRVAGIDYVHMPESGSDQRDSRRLQEKKDRLGRIRKTIQNAFKGKKDRGKGRAGRFRPRLPALRGTDCGALPQEACGGILEKGLGKRNHRAFGLSPLVAAVQLLEKGQLPELFPLVVPDDVQAPVVSDDLEIPMVRRKPHIEDLHYAYLSSAHFYHAGDLLSPIACVANHFYCHFLLIRNQESERFSKRKTVRSQIKNSIQGLPENYNPGSRLTYSHITPSQRQPLHWPPEPKASTPPSQFQKTALEPLPPSPPPNDSSPPVQSLNLPLAFPPAPPKAPSPPMQWMNVPLASPPPPKELSPALQFSKTP